MKTTKDYDTYDDYDFTDYIPDVFRAEKIRVAPIGEIPDLDRPAKWWQKQVMAKGWGIIVWDELLNDWLETPFVVTGETEDEALAAYDKDNKYVQLEYRIWRHYYQLQLIMDGRTVLLCSSSE